MVFKFTVYYFLRKPECANLNFYCMDLNSYTFCNVEFNELQSVKLWCVNLKRANISPREK